AADEKREAEAQRREAATVCLGLGRRRRPSFISHKGLWRMDDNGARFQMRHKLRGGVAAAALWVMSIPGLGFAQTAAAGAIGGVVKDEAGLAVAGAIITLETAAGAGERTAATDQAGAFHFGDVAAGRYNVTVAAGGVAGWTANVAAGGLHQAAGAAGLQVAAGASAIG